MKLLAAIASILLLACALEAQAPAPLPGYQVSLTAGYSLLTGAQSNNGFFSSVAAPLITFNRTNSFTLSGRGDYFSIATPSSYVVSGGPEVRFQFSSAQFFSGKVFQPYGNFGVGIAKSSCTGCDTSGHAAWKIGGGLDMVGTPTLTYRLFEIDYIHSRIYPNNGVVLNNFAQVMTGLKLTF
jgi:hypothetical protein